MKNFDSRADKLPRKIKVSNNREEKHENHRDSNELELVKDEGQDYGHDYGQNYVHNIGIIPFKIRKK